jgi:alpha-L-fucosidase
MIASKKIKSIELLGSAEKIKWAQKADGLSIDSPKLIPANEALCFKIVF